MKRKHIVWLLISLFLCGMLACGNADVDNKKAEDYKRSHPSAFQVNAFLCDISPDNKTLLFDYGSPYWMKIGTYDMSTGKVRIFSHDKNKMNYAPCFSRDGEKIVFTSAKERGYTQNIFMINTDGSGLSQITKFPEEKNKDIIYASAPSFSPDGKRIIFLRSHAKRERAYPLRGEMHSEWDLYELDIATGAERRLTNYNFYNVSWPYYMADGKRFIFSGEGPYNPKGPGPKDFKEYEAKYQKNFIFIMDGENNELKPAFVNGSHSFRPHVSSNDIILFISMTNEMEDLKTAKDTQDLFLYRKGKIKRLTKSNAYITWARISRDGSRVIFAKKSDKKSQDESDWLMKSDGTGLKEIKIPMDKLKQ